MNENDNFRMFMRNEMAKAMRQAEEKGMNTEGFSMMFDKNKKSQIKWKPNSHFIKFYNTELVNVIKNYNLDSYELSTILLLLPYVEYETNLIAKDGIALMKKDIVNILEYSENKTDNILDSLVDKKILAKTKVGRSLIYHMNPNLVFRGVFLSPETESIFRNLD